MQEKAESNLPYWASNYSTCDAKTCHFVRKKLLIIIRPNIFFIYEIYVSNYRRIIECQFISIYII